MDDKYTKYDYMLDSLLQDPCSEPQSVPLEYLRKITNDFCDNQLLGQGGFGKVYKGILQNAKTIAVKKLRHLKPGIQERQFENEVYYLMKLKHPNIVRFVGYCYEIRNECVEYNGKYIFAEMQQRLLCLEYLPNGSLDGHLSDESSGLDWHIRHKIIKGICHGLHYLHEECKCQINASIIHLDLKPANVLLDENMVPKVADFGLSRLFEDKKTQTCTSNPAGSLGYMAPEYLYRQIITTKADIYSLGVIIIEIITGKRVDPFYSVTNCQDLVESVVKSWRIRLEASPTYRVETECQQIGICLEIGLSCIKINHVERPTIGEIIEKLNNQGSSSCSVSEEERLPSDELKGTALRLHGAATNKSPVESVGITQESSVESIGVCYGMRGDNLPPSSAVVQLYRSKGITRMRIYFPSKQALDALRGSGISLILDTDFVLSQLAYNRSYATSWVKNNVSPYYPAVNIKYIAVGNKVWPEARHSILPAIANLTAALHDAGLGAIKASTSVAFDAVANSFPPSSGEFAQSYMVDIVRYLQANGAPLLASVYPYFVYEGNLRGNSLGYATFQPGTTVQDTGNGLTYTNLFDEMTDALVAALEKAGASSVRIVISETGWPSAGGFGASVDNARKYNQGLIDHVRRGTPKRPGALEAYIFGMFNENQKGGQETKRNFGLFYPDQQPVYPIRF